jgi:Uncharacterised nucleotidyltransferase
VALNNRPPTAELQSAILSLLRGEVPSEDAPAAVVDACLKRYECGSYLHRLWSVDGRSGGLPRGWADGIARAYRRTVVDNLGALAQFRDLGRHFAEEKVPFILLKGAAYLTDLYDDPGARMLTDIDLLLRRRDVGRIARRLAGAGYEGHWEYHRRDYRRFEMWLPRAGQCRFELHWWLGLPHRFRIGQEELWQRSVPTVLEDVACRRLAPEDALLYHVAHLAEHYYGPTLKWVLDLREMLRRWRIDHQVLVERASSWRIRTALDLALEHLGKLFPGEVPEGLRERLASASMRARLLRRYRSGEPLELLHVPEGRWPRYPLRFLMVDRPSDALGAALRILARPLTRTFVRALGLAGPPWTWPD